MKPHLIDQSTKPGQLEMEQLVIDVGKWYGWHCRECDNFTMEPPHRIDPQGEDIKDNYICLCHICQKAVKEHKIECPKIREDE